MTRNRDQYMPGHLICNHVGLARLAEDDFRVESRFRRMAHSELRADSDSTRLGEGREVNLCCGPVPLAWLL